MSKEEKVSKELLEAINAEYTYSTVKNKRSKL